ncbi:MAG: hypothetical protein HRT47_01435 [Candidatus Caenarcaniphilales bacterium]|nr:hypothetical protein [Candidatus Caenarcaniphilales bacterium]
MSNLKNRRNYRVWGSIFNSIGDGLGSYSQMKAGQNKAQRLQDALSENDMGDYADYIDPYSGEMSELGSTLMNNELSNRRANNMYKRDLDLLENKHQKSLELEGLRQKNLNQRKLLDKEAQEKKARRNRFDKLLQNSDDVFDTYGIYDNIEDFEDAGYSKIDLLKRIADDKALPQMMKKKVNNFGMFNIPFLPEKHEIEIIDEQY